jgi:hypothetical protein
MTPPAATEQRGKAYLFADSPAVIHDPMDKLTAGLTDYLGVRARDIRAIWENPVFSARTQNRLRAQWGGVVRAAEDFSAMRVRSFSHAYEVAAGHPMAGRTREAAGTSTFVSALANALNISLIASYASADYFEWTLARTSRATDFRPRKAVTISEAPSGLPVVLEGAAYAELLTPTEQATTYSIAKRGALQVVSYELVKNDNVGVIARMTENLGRAARKACAELVWSLWTSNANSSDGTAWFSVAHANTGTAPLDGVSVVAAIKQLLAQTPLGSTARQVSGTCTRRTPALARRPGEDLLGPGPHPGAGTYRQ